MHRDTLANLAAMRITSIPTVLAAALALALPLLACDTAGGRAALDASGTQTVRAEQGITFVDGALVESANFANADLFATRNGTSLKLSTGGDNPTVNRPVTWFKTSGGVFPTFASLAEVPTTLPSADQTESLVKAKAGNGFVLQTMRGTYVHGWIASVDADSVTIQFAPAVPEE